MPGTVCRHVGVRSALKAWVSGLKGSLTGGGGVASMAAVTGKGLEGPEEGVGKQQLGRLGGLEET